MKLPIRMRVALSVTLSFAAVVILLSALLIELYERYSFRSFDVTLQAAASSVANRLAEENLYADPAGNREDIGETISAFQSKIGVLHVGVFDQYGSEALSVGDQDSVTHLVPRATGGDFLSLTEAGREYRAAFAQFEIGDTAQGTVVVAGLLSSTRESVDRVRRLVFLIAPLTIVIVAVGSVAISRRALRPLERIAMDIDRIQVDQPLARLGVPRTGDEIERVAESFNALVQRLSMAVESQRNFLLDASHELKTPLTVIQTEIEMLLMKPHLTASERNNLKQLVAEAEYASKVATDLIYLSKLESSAITRFSMEDLDSIVTEVISHQRSIARRKRIRLDANFANKCKVKADHGLLQRALSNAVENAIKYTRRGGVVTVSTFHDQSSSKAIILVEDNGVGIGPEELARVFDRFYRTRSSRGSTEKGSGLGLSIAKRIIEDHGGEISIMSTEGVGTKVRIELPLTG